MTWNDWLVQGFERADRQFLDAEMLAGRLVPAGSMFASVHRADVFPDADYADLFAPPGVAPAVAVGHQDGSDLGAASAA